MICLFLKNLDLEWLAGTLHNPMIERAAMARPKHCAQARWPQLPYPDRPEISFQPPSIIDLEISDKKLIELSDTGLLALNLEEMKAIQAHYRDPNVQKAREAIGLHPNAPTDVELECLAQTWSEHCKHKIFAARIHHVDTITGEETEIDMQFYYINFYFIDYSSNPKTEIENILNPTLYFVLANIKSPES